MSIYLGAPDSIEKDSFNTILPSNGISSTPVIDFGNPPDPRTATLYVVAKLKRNVPVAVEIGRQASIALGH
jgi:hypothetical protein